MNEELIDSAWRVLPNEFKEEVKKRYKGCLFTANRYAKVEADLLEEFFGIYNLTSDAKGEEDEMLCVSRKKLQYFYESLRKVGKNHAAFVLRSLFGSKCLPDEAASESASKVANEEPKYRVGERVRCLNDGETHIVLAKTGKYHYALQGVEHDVHEDCIELYTEPTSTFTDDCQSQCKSQDRLQIAAMAMQGLLANEAVSCFTDVQELDHMDFIIYHAFEYADKLIHKSKEEDDI